MLYAPSPYSSGTEVPVYEQDQYSTGTPPSPPTGLSLTGTHQRESSEQDNNNSPIATDAQHESPPPTPKHIILPQDDQHTTALCDTEEDDFFFLGQLQNKTVALDKREQQQQQQQQEEQDQQQLVENGNYSLYESEYQDTGETSLYHYQQQHQQQQQQHYHSDQGAAYTFEHFDTSAYSTPSITDDDFETANRAFHATINKFSRQNYPEHRKRAPYNFLENWHLHSMYSKSQQILLGIPHVRPMVLLSGDDFMFTPPLLQQEEDDDYLGDNDQLGYLDQSMQMDWMDDGQMFEDGNDIMDDGIVIMSAPDPPPLMELTILSTATTPPLPPPSTVLNENAWMKNQTGFMHEHYQLDHNNNSNNIDDIDHYHQQQDSPSLILSSDKEPLYFAGGLSSELLHWYRTADRGRPPSTIMEIPENDEGDQTNDQESINVRINLDDNNIITNNNEIDCARSEDGKGNMETTEKQSTLSSDQPDITDQPALDHHGSPTSYQSLADIVSLSSSSASTPLELLHYGSTNGDHQYHTDPASSSYSQSRWTHHSNISFSDQLATTSEHILTLASDYRLDGKATTLSFMSCMLKIWQIWILTAQIMLAGLWGQTLPSPSLTNTKLTHRSTSVKPLLPL